MTVYSPGRSSRVFRFSSYLRQREGMVCLCVGVFGLQIRRFYLEGIWTISRKLF